MQGEGSVQSQSQGTETGGLINLHPAFTDIGKVLNEYNDALGDIQLSGVSHVVDLPELVLVGDQSSGKSTLMSALALLDLPTSSGICTRCPFHIRTSPSKDSRWSCTVSLQQEYEYRPPENRAIRQSDVTRRNPFPPWVPKPAKETIVFKTIYEQDSKHLDEILRWAQIATLNPRQDPEQFVPGEGNYAKENDLETAKRSTEARFSPNVVSLEIKGPCHPPLSFLDLPGIFAISEVKGDDYLVDVVENLTRKYVAREGTMVMLALPMDHDIDNSRTLRVIRELDAESRTIGVLTKADRPNFNVSDTINYWLDVLGEKRQKVKKDGFYITSLPQDKGPNNFNAWEDSYFRAGTSNWPRAFDDYVHRCGVDQLRVHVAKELGDAFARSLPDIKEKFNERLEEIRYHLDELPDLPRNVEHDVRMSLRDFYSSVQQAVNDSEFEHGCKALTEEFYHRLVTLKPRCVLRTERPSKRPRDTIVISDDSDDNATSSKRRAPKSSSLGSTPKRQHLSALPTTPALVKAEESPGGGAVSRSPVGPASALSRFSRNGVVKLSILEIRDEIRRKTRGGFGNVVPLEVHETLCLRAVSQWERPLEEYTDKAIDMLRATVIRALRTALWKFSKRLIYREVHGYLMTFLENQAAVQRKRSVELYQSETYKAVTVNEKGLNDVKGVEKARIERYRLFQRGKEAGLIDEDRAFSTSEAMPQEEKDEQTSLAQKLRDQLPEDEFTREVDVTATVNAYYLTAAMRFADSVSMDINSRLFRSFRNGALGCFLDDKLELSYSTPVEVYARLMEEDTATAEKRVQLRKEREKIIAVMERIAALERSHIGYTVTGQGSIAYPDGISEEHNEKMEI